MADLPIFQPLPDYDPGSVDLDLNSQGIPQYVAPYNAPAEGQVMLDFWGPASHWRCSWRSSPL